MPRVEPERSCLGCRKVSPKHELLRFVLDPERRLIADPQNKLPGRGAYVCCQKSCLQSAVEKRQFSRSFKGEVKTGTAQELLTSLGTGFRERIIAYLSLANKAGKVISGSDQIFDAFRKGTPRLLFLAEDISAESADKFIATAGRSHVEVYYLLTKESLGAALGKEMRSAAVIVESGFVAALQQELIRYRNFFQEGAVR
jgi:predicted RNA-binding protein YlxR (DUF448 family)/ribosomal protein L7Ae-like RNA K-turn-binding protein